MNQIDSAAQGSVKVGIRPEVTMLSVLQHLNYKAWYAMAEFIDNAIQSFETNRSSLEKFHEKELKLKIHINIDAAEPGRIVITDNAAGISEYDFPRAFRTAQPPSDRSGLSEFGMGMKSAACWFAKNWSVRTKALNETVERTINFDIQSIVDHRLENLSPTEQKATRESHYTVVTLWNLHHIPQGRTVGKIRAHLASIYRVYLRKGNLEIIFNGEPLEYTSPAILNSIPFTSAGSPTKDEDAKPVSWQKEIAFDFGKGQKVKGFAALRETGSTPLAGFALFRRNRLIEGSHDETYRPSQIFKQTNSYPYQRLFGELHLEGFDVSHTKDGFRWEEHEDIFLEFLKAELESSPLNLLLQAESYRSIPNKRTIEAQAIAATNSVASYIENHVAPYIVDARLNPSEPSPLPSELPSNQLDASERVIEVHDGRYLWVILLKTTIDPACEDWLSVAKNEKEDDNFNRIRRLTIELSLAHPFSTQFLGPRHENIELYLRISTAVCVSLVLAEDMTGAAPETFLFNFNQLIRGALAHSGAL
ncbi:ATP-binding protein [Pseudomonas sichuanensis]|uniref:ATP-binding protein n=1 Tax=Pseudomonas sichuanensis TaxID=2213015 RepID=UPI00380A3E74